MELVTDIQDGLFAELKTDAPKIDPLRRQLQRSYLDILKAEFQPPAASGSPLTPPVRPASELRAVSRVTLAQLATQLEAAKKKTKDPQTIAHIDDLSSEIAAILAADKKK